MKCLWRLLAIVLFGLGLLNVSEGFARGRHAKIKVSGALQSDLNAILSATNELHGACYNKNERKIEASLKLVLANIDRASQKSALAKDQRPHLMKILNAARSQLEMSQMLSGQKRRDSLKVAFNQLVQISHIYKLDSYRVFFCPRDKSVWLQKSWKAKNPIHPDKFPRCGKLVR